MNFIRCLFTNVGGVHWELARVLAAKASVAYTFAFIYALVVLRNVPDWSALGIGYGAVLAGAGALIFAKDTARTKAVAAEHPDGAA